MQFQHHVNVTFTALRRWFVAQCYDALIVGLLWLGVLLWLRVPWAPFWAMMAGALQFVPHLGPVLALIGPAMAMLFSRASLAHWFWFLAAYAGIALLDSLLVQPLLLRKTNRVPPWASILTPLVLGLVFPFWGVMLAPPLLAVLYAQRGATKSKPEAARGQQFSSTDQGVILPPSDGPRGK